MKNFTFLFQPNTEVYTSELDCDDHLLAPTTIRYLGDILLWLVRFFLCQTCSGSGDHDRRPVPVWVTTKVDASPRACPVTSQWSGHRGGALTHACHFSCRWPPTNGLSKASPKCPSQNTSISPNPRVNCTCQPFDIRLRHFDQSLND